MTARAVASVVCLGVALVAAAAPQPEPPPTDRWAPLRPLLGRWEGESVGRPGRGTVRREYRLVLGDRFVEVRNTSTCPPHVPKTIGETDEDVGYISFDTRRQVYVFRQFHIEGFVNTYTGAVEPGAPMVFASEAIENIPPGWRARERYRLTADGGLVETFELAEPGQSFAAPTEARLRRQQ